MAERGESEELLAGLSGALTPTGHRLMARVRYGASECNSASASSGVSSMTERGRSDFLRLSGVHHSELVQGRRGERIVWVVRRMEIDFVSPARMDDILTIDTRTDKISGARIFMAQEIRRGEEVLISAMVEAAIVGENGRPRRFPKEWVEAFLPKG